MGNGAKAAQKRERNAKAGAKEGKSSLKVNEAAKNIVCGTCKQAFLVTTRLPALQQHVENKHSGKTVADCFPTYTGS
ncbi:hypothetical protein FRC03_003576 [Tulasnella sp. 419]|nr:hypothetical protein FRC02_001403 [Tulasnella sp. 418]KAG8962959.1 hypothetical protein FRC03_003576 [Tulasnella sp. 419]